MSITIEQLAAQLGESVWAKEGMKRIYLNDAGWNTKKMSTKTYIFQDQEGDFKVSCHVDCPSQPWQWCKSQEDEVKRSVYEDIEKAIELSKISLVKFTVLSEWGFGTIVYIQHQDDTVPTWYTEEIFYEKFGKYPEDVFEDVAKVWKEYRAAQKEIEESNKKEELELKQKARAIETKKLQESGAIPVEASRVKHGRFGLGNVIKSDPDTIEIRFDSDEFGTKKLLTRFVKLEVVND